MLWRKKKKAPRGDGKRRKLEEMDFQDLVGILDREFSFYIRMLHANEDGTAVPCYITRVWYPFEKIDAGHYINRSYYGVRWDPRNVKPQSQYLNRFQEGVHAEFRKKLVEEYGEEEVVKLEQYAAFFGKTRHPREWLLEQIKHYRELNKEMRRRKRTLMEGK